MTINSLLNAIKQNEIIDYVWISARNIKDHNKRRELIDNYRKAGVFRALSLGDINKGKVIFLIDPAKSYTSGFFSNLSFVLLKFRYAEDHGMYPVIYKESESHLNEPEIYKGADNFYEYFFEQPTGITSEEGLKSRLVVKNDTKAMKYFKKFSNSELDRILIKQIKKDLKIKPDVLKELERAKEEFIGDRKVLGVKYRGTGYKWPHKGHPVYISIEEIIDEVKKELKNGYDAIYLATEDEDALQVFEQDFGSLLIYDKNILRASKGKLHIDLATSDPGNHTAYMEGLNVLRDVWVLANAKSFIGAQCGVSKFVYLFHEAYGLPEYKTLKIIDKGVYEKGVDSIKEGIKMYGNHSGKGLNRRKT